MIKSNVDGPGRPLWCLTCGTIIQSKFRHDLVPCACMDEATQIFIDGGNAYTRIGYGPRAKFEFADLDYAPPEVGASHEVNTEAGVYDEVPEVPSGDDGDQHPQDTA